MAILQTSRATALSVLVAISTLFISGGCQNLTGNPLVNLGCNSLAQQFPTQVYLPGSAAYANETSTFWSKTTVLTPYCVYSPSSAADVSAAIKILSATSTQFAVRGAGHMPVKAAASTDQGVLIVMDQFQNMILTSKGSEQVASIGPGLTWWDVYQWISSHDLMVVGGRYAPVGVPGLLLGGGISYFSGQFGWAANNVLGYEIVLGNGTILEVTSSSHPDLFWTLKGGSSNYGIVTRFDLRTFDLPTVYAGTLSIDTPYMPDFLDAIESWVEPNGGIETPAAAIVPNVFVFPSTGVVQGNCAIFYDGNHTGITNKSSAPAVLQNFTNIPTISTTAKQQSFVSYVEETLQYENRSFRNSFHATSFVAAPQVVRIMNETLVPAAISQLKDVADCYVSGNLQPVSTNWLRYAQAAGGDAISLDPSDGNVFAFNLFVQWSNPADDDTVTAFATEVLTAMDNATSAANLSYPFIYLNDAAGGEQIYQYYGKGKSLPKMRSISQDYDPNGVFQYLMPGGFKIGR